MTATPSSGFISEHTVPVVHPTPPQIKDKAARKQVSSFYPVPFSFLVYIIAQSLKYFL